MKKVTVTSASAIGWPAASLTLTSSMFSPVRGGSGRFFDGQFRIPFEHQGHVSEWGGVVDPAPAAPPEKQNARGAVEFLVPAGAGEIIEEGRRRNLYNAA